MKRLIVIVCILLSFVGFSNAEVETDPVKRIYLQMDLENVNDSIDLCVDSGVLNNLLPRCERLVKKLYKEEDLANYLVGLAHYYSDLGDYAEAIRLSTEAINIRKEVHGENTRTMATSLANLALYNFHQGNYKETIDLLIHRNSIINSLYGYYSNEYTISLVALCEVYFEIEEYTKVIDLSNELKKRFCQPDLIKESHSYDFYYTYLFTTAYSHYYLNNYRDFTNYCDELLTLCKNENASYSELIQYLYLDMASAYFQMREIQKSLDYIDLASNLLADQYEVDNGVYGIILLIRAKIGLYQAQYKDALNYCLEANRLIIKHYGYNHTYYYDSLLVLASLYTNLGNNKEAMEYNIKATENIIKLFGEKNEYYVLALSNLADILYNSKRPYDAIGVGEEALSIYENLVHKNIFIQVSLYRGLGTYYKAVGNYENAMILEDKALSIIHNTLGKNNEEYLNLLINKLNTHQDLQDYTTAFNLAEEIIYQYDYILKNDSLSDHLGVWENDSSMLKARILDTFSLLYKEGQDYEGALASAIEAKEIYETHNVKNHDYARLLCNIASYNIDRGLETEDKEYFSMAIRYCQQAKNILEELGVPNANAFLTMSNAYFYLNNYHLAFDYNKKGYDILKIYLSPEHPDCLKAGENLINSSFYAKKTSELVYYTHNIVPLKSKQILQNLHCLVYRDRAKLLNSERAFFTERLPLYTYSISNDSLTLQAFNGILLGKGLLLNAEIELANLIAECGDQEAEDLYNKLLATRRWLNKLYERPISERRVDTDSLENVAETLERELIEKSKVYGDFTRNLTIDWEQVQSKLGDDDIAIEFVSFPTENDSMMYCALTLKNGYESPRMTPLFEAQNLAKIDRDGYYTTASIYNLVWKPLANEIGDAKNIYFSPTGELYNIAIESVPIAEKDKYVFDKWNLYRLSSTRELAVTKSEKNTPNVVLYGGLRYDADGVNFEKDATGGTNYLTMTRVLPDSLGLRAQYGYLPGTLNEVTEINALYEKNSIPTLLYTDSIGTESTLKSLSGKHISNLHISTHGFYYSEEEIERKKNLKYLSLLQLDDTPQYIEDKSMTRSGLLFAGANAILKGDSIPEGCDDGILTAQEIASLDFRGLDLLVLSACQTGLGEIKGDGVFGLQRGFKKAGVQTIVMSLWKVDDDATQMLMSAFYENLLVGKTKREAFLSAQEKVRNFVGEFNGKICIFSDPKYWAGFIMLD